MQKIKIGLGALVVGILAVSMTTVAVGSVISVANGKIIPVADEARDNAAAPLHSPVIDVDWVLTPLSNSNKAKIPTADGKTIPAAEQAKNNAAAPLHSPVIDVDWVLGPLPNSSGPDSSPLNMPLEINCEFPGAFSTGFAQEQVGLQVVGLPDGSSFAATPEPSTMALLTLGTLVLVRRRR